MARLIYSDPTPRWAPFALVGVVVALVWGSMVWQIAEFALPNLIALWLGGILLVGVFLQGLLFWRGQVDTLTESDGRYEAVTMRWVGRGKRINFTAAETSAWRAIPKSGTPTTLATLEFAVRGRTLSLSLLNPERVDLDALSALAPDFIRTTRQAYPTLVTKPVALRS